MSVRVCAVSILLISVLACRYPLFTQGESALPLLLIHPSPDANAWGHVATAVVSTNPIATITNPALLGIFALDGYFAASMYSPKNKWPPRLGLPDLTYDVKAIRAGYDLSKALDLPFRLGIGAGYSRVFFSLGEFVSQNGFRYRPYEKFEGLSIGFGIEY